MIIIAAAAAAVFVVLILIIINYNFHICSEWKSFNYEPRTVSFACEVGSPGGKDVVSGIHLPQFSSATVPKVN